MNIKKYINIFLLIFLIISPHDKIYSQKKNELNEKKLKDWIVYFLDSLEQIENKINFLIKEIKSFENETINVNKIKKDYNSIINAIYILIENNKNFLNSMNQEQKFLIKRQIDILEESFYDLQKFHNELDKILGKNKDEIFNKTKQFEKTVKTIHRQYLAIEFILLQKAFSITKFS